MFNFLVELFPDRSTIIKFSESVQIKWYAVIILLGAIIALLTVKRNLKRDGKDPAMYDTFFCLVLPIAIVGCRIWYVLGDLDEMHSLYDVIAIWDGGLAIQGGVMAGAIFGYFYFKKKSDIPIAYHFDNILPAVLIGQAVGRWGNFFNQEVYGKCVSEKYLWWVPDGLLNSVSNSPCPVDGTYHLPLFLIESMLTLFGFLMLCFVIRYNWKKGRKPFDLACIYSLYYGLVRIVLELFREEEYIMKIFGIPFSVITSAIFIIAGVSGLILTRIYNKNVTYDNLYGENWLPQMQEKPIKTDTKEDLEEEARRQKLIADKIQELKEQRKNEKDKE